MNFKEQIENDFDNVFFNVEEFGEMHIIEGKSVPIVIDNEQLKEFYVRKSVDTKEIFTDKIMFYIQQKHLDFEPVAEQYISFDGHDYRISDVSQEGTIYTIIIEVNGS